MKRSGIFDFLCAAALLVLLPLSLAAQGGPQGDGVTVARPTATATLNTICTTRGALLFHGASAWQCRTPGTSGLFLQSAGAGADPVYAAAEIPGNKGVANGYASLDSSGLIPTAQLPALAISDTFAVASQAAMLALTAQKGDVAVRSDEGKTYILSTNSPTTLADWKELLSVGQVSSVAGRTGAVTLGITDVGLPSASGTNTYLKWSGSAFSWASIAAGSGDLVSTNNLSDVANAATSLSNLGGIGAATTNTLTNKTFDTAGAGNSLSINGVAATANTGTGSVVRATSPTLVTPVLGVATATTINGATVPSASDTLVGRATTDTLTNKTLTAPVIATISNTGTLTLPTSTDTLVGRATTDTLTNKTLTAAVLGSSTATTQAANDNSTKVATTAYVDGAVGRVYRVVSASVDSTTTTVPVDDTKPQNTEGKEFFSVTLTPRSATSTLDFHCVFNGSHSAATATVAFSIFQDSGADSLATSWLTQVNASYAISLPLIHTMTSGTTSAVTYKFRAGADAAGTLTMNGAGGSRLYGGAMKSGCTIWETL